MISEPEIKKNDAANPKEKERYEKLTGLLYSQACFRATFSESLNDATISHSCPGGLSEDSFRFRFLASFCSSYFRFGDNWNTLL